MADDLTLVSTTDSPEAVAEAMGVSVESTTDIFGQPLQQSPTEPPDSSTGAVRVRETAPANDESEATPHAETPVDDTRGEETPTARRQHGGHLQKRLHKVLKENQALRAALIDRPTSQTPPGTPPPTYPASYTAEALVPPAPATPKPVVTDFQTYEDWAEAIADWKADRKVRQVLQEQVTARVEHQQAAAFHAERAAVRQQFSDYDAVLAAAADVPVSPEAERLLVASPSGPSVMYHLASDPALKKAFSRSNAVEQVRMIGQLEAQIGVPARRTPTSGGPSRRARPITQAPDPIEPVGTSGVTTTKSPDQMTYQEYRAWRQAGGGRR